MANGTRGRALTVFAVLFGILAVSNFSKPLQLGGSQTGFVFFGQRLSGTANDIAGPLFGLYLAVYASSIWGMRRRALWMSRLYASYVLLNLVLFNFRTPDHPTGSRFVLFTLVYATVALGVSGGAAYLLARRRDDLT